LYDIVQYLALASGGEMSGAERIAAPLLASLTDEPVTALFVF
jgi:hypothetical protein